MRPKLISLAVAAIAGSSIAMGGTAFASATPHTAVTLHHAAVRSGHDAHYRGDHSWHWSIGELYHGWFGDHDRDRDDRSGNWDRQHYYFGGHHHSWYGDHDRDRDRGGDRDRDRDRGGDRDDQGMHFSFRQ
jgi:hypothetical protein